jgi:hypothetical protein
VKTVERLNKYLEVKKIKVAVFERACKVANGYFGKQLRVKGSIGSDILEKVAEVYPDLNIVWLITGKGAMITKPPTTTKEDKETNIILEEEQEVYKKEVELWDGAKKIFNELSALKRKKREKAVRRKKG